MCHLKNNSGFLQQVSPHVCSNDPVLLIKADLCVFSKSAAVVISSGFCIPYGLKKRCIFLDANLFRAIHRFESNSCFDKRCTSVIGLDANTLSSTRVLLPDLLTTAKYLIAYRADTVLPAPDSPLTMIDWFLWFLKEKMNFRTSITLSFYMIVWGFYCLAICLYASSATENIWGSMSPMFWPE